MLSFSASTILDFQVLGDIDFTDKVTISEG